MSDDLLKKITRLEKRLDREKLARKEAERLLEEKSRTLYDANQDLEQQVTEAKRRQKQLAFLTGLSSEIGGASSIDVIVKIFLNKSRIFLNKAHAVFVKINLDNMAFELTPFDFNSQNKKEVDEKFAFLRAENVIETLVKLAQQAEYESQLMPLSDLCDGNEDASYCFVVPVVNLKKQLGVAVYYYAAGEQLDVFKLQTMESARVSLQTAIKQKLTSLKLASRYQELKKTHLQLNETQKQLVHSEKMASLGELAAGVAHEINNPVGYVLSNYETLNEYLQVMTKLLEINSDMLADDAESAPWLAPIKALWQDEDIDFIKEDVQELVAASKSGLKRVQEIVSGLKEFSHTNSTEAQPTSLVDCLEDALQLVSNELKYGHKVEKHFCSSRQICGRSGALQQVFVNMLVNAKQAMPDGGTISIELKEDNDFQVLSISDSGVGIKQADIAKLFTPFYTTKPVGVGTGLGLSISYGILQDHDATITVESEVGKGTTFVMRFPVMK